MEDKVSFFCPKCGTLLEAPTEMSGAEAICPTCSQSMIVPASPDLANPSLSLADGMIDLSNDRAAALNRWLKAIREVLFTGFGIAAVSVLDVSFSLVTLIASLIWLFAARLLCCGIGKGALWARVSTYLLVILSAIVAVYDWQEFDLLDWVGLVLFVLAAAMLLLPNVSSKLKELGRGLKSTGKACLLFWAVLIFSTVLVGNAPEAKGLRDYEIPRALFLIGAVIISHVFELLARCFDGGLHYAMGGATGDAPVVYSKSRNVSCPKCGQLISVPDTDDNDQVACPSCRHEFYPFGRSSLAILAFYLGLVSPLLLPAPFALVCGILALKDIKKNRGKHGIVRAKVGVVIGGIITGLFCLPIALPIYFYFRKKKSRAHEYVDNQ